jgi:hypothetical protein
MLFKELESTKATEGKVAKAFADQDDLSKQK